MPEHRLRREIITTAAGQRGGQPGRDLVRLPGTEETGAPPPMCSGRTWSSATCSGCRSCGRPWRTLDNQVPTAAQTAAYLLTRRLLDRAVRWLVSRPALPVGRTGGDRPTAARRRPTAAAAGELFRGNEQAALRARTRVAGGQGFPEERGRSGGAGRRTASGWSTWSRWPRPGRPDSDAIDDVAAIYFTLSERFRVDAILSQISALPRRGPLADPGPDGAALRPVRRAGRPDLAGVGLHVADGGSRGPGRGVGAARTT